MGEFSFGDVVHAVTSKMIRRHPHVFDVSDADTPDTVKLQWDRIKAEEKRERAERRLRRGITEDFKAGFLGGVQRSQPALTEALKLQEQAARVGFDWSDPAPILDKIEEEIAELREALAEGKPEKVSDELGDLIFALVNIGRHVKTDPENAARHQYEIPQTFQSHRNIAHNKWRNPGSGDAGAHGRSVASGQAHRAFARRLSRSMTSSRLAHGLWGDTVEIFRAVKCQSIAARSFRGIERRIGHLDQRLC